MLTTGLLLATASCGGGDGDGSSPRIISNAARFRIEAETSIAVGPDRSVAIAWIGIDPTHHYLSVIEYVISHDDGVTFGPIGTLKGPDPYNSDPALAIDGAGNFYIVWGTFEQIGSAGHIFLATAPRGANQFANVVEVTDPTVDQSYDKPWIIVSNQNTVLVTYSNAAVGQEVGDRHIAATSSDRGMTWRRSVISERGSHVYHLAFPCAPPTGDRLYVAFGDLTVGDRLAFSDDQGASWQSNTVLFPGETLNGDPKCVANGNDVWVIDSALAMAFDPFQPLLELPVVTQILLAHSSDRGQTIDRRAAANDTVGGSFYLLPQLAIESSGALDLTYVASDTRSAAYGSLRRTRSIDGGQHFAPSATVLPLLFVNNRTGCFWLGDYSGLTWARGGLYISYTDNRGGCSHVGFYRTSIK